MAQAKLGIVAGSGRLPARLIAHCVESGRPFFVLAIEGETDPVMVADAPHGWTRLGAAARGFELLRGAGVAELVLAGAIKRPSITALRPDWRAAKLFARIGLRALGDDGLLRAVIGEIEGEGFRVVGVDEVLGTGCIAVAGAFGRHEPDAQGHADIGHGMRLLRALGPLDIGQAVVVQQGLVLGVEAIEGTDELARRCAKLARPGAAPVLVKARKHGQEARIDLPTIGSDTVLAAAAAGFSGIAVEAGGTIVVDLRAAVAAADRHGLFVYGAVMPET